MKLYLYLLLPALIVSAQTKLESLLSDHLIEMKPFIGNTYKGNFINSTKENYKNANIKKSRDPIKSNFRLIQISNSFKIYINRGRR